MLTIVRFVQYWSFLRRVLALFLNHIGNPAPRTVSGISETGKCRPNVSLVHDVFQSTTTILKEYNTSLVATTIRQGAGLVDAYAGITTSAFFSPGKLALRDSIRQRPSYIIRLFNADQRTARYKLSHRGAALATGKEPNNDLLSRFPKYSADYAVSVQRTLSDIRQSGKWSVVSFIAGCWDGTTGIRSPTW